MTAAAACRACAPRVDHPERHWRLAELMQLFEAAGAGWARADRDGDLPLAERCWDVAEAARAAMTAEGATWPADGGFGFAPDLDAEALALEHALLWGLA